MPPVIHSSIFGELTKNVQARIDAASELNKRIFDNVVYRNYLGWDTPTIGLDFEEIIGKFNLTIAALRCTSAASPAGARSPDLPVRGRWGNRGSRRNIARSRRRREPTVLPDSR